MSDMTPQEAADVVERGTVPSADRALRVLIDHARAAAPEGGDLTEIAESLEANAADMRSGHDASEPDLRNAAEAIRAHRCAPSVAAPPREDEDIDPHRLGEALDFAWSAWIGDVGHVPDAFHLHPADARVSATFADSEFARLAAGRYDALTTEAGTVRDPERAL